ncbi:unnamed protein product [Bathycoccus prasinos]
MGANGFFESLDRVEEGVKVLHDTELEGRHICVRIERKSVENSVKEGEQMDNPSSGVQVVVRNLPWTTTKDDLSAVFTEVGKVSAATVKCFSDSGRSKGWATVRFETKEEAETAIERFNGTDFGGREIEYGEEFFLGKVAELDDLTFLRWAREEKGLKWDKWVSSASAEQGNLEMLKYCFEHGCPLDDYTAICAAHNGHLRCLKFLIEDAKVNWYDQTACAAAEGGHLEILRMPDDIQCKCDEFAAFGGHIECLNYLHQIGVPWSEEVPIYASQAGKIEILERIHELGCPLNEDACSEAALHGHLDLLKFLRNELKCPWDSGTPALASLRGHREVLEWCFQNDAPICVHSAVNASRNGHVDCLQFLHEHHAPVNGHVVRFARMYEQHECLKFALMNDYPDDITEPMNIWTEMD